MYIASSLTSGCWWSDSTSDSKKDGEGDARPGQTCVNILPCLYFGWVRPPLLSGIWVINGDYMGLHVIRRIDKLYFLCVWCLHLFTLFIYLYTCRQLAMSILYFGGCNPLHSIDVGGWRYWQTMLPGQTTIPTMPMESNAEAQQDWHGFRYSHDATSFYRILI